jgi:hypothetical protein
MTINWQVRMIARASLEDRRDVAGGKTAGTAVPEEVVMSTGLIPSRTMNRTKC